MHNHRSIDQQTTPSACPTRPAMIPNPQPTLKAILVAALSATLAATMGGCSDVADSPDAKLQGKVTAVHLGPRPFHLADALPAGELKETLLACDTREVAPQDFSIGHRGAPLQFPEHTRESYVAAARMGAGIIECDVTFTRDRKLVCRHSQCDLHTTTNILDTELVAQCSVPPNLKSTTPFADVKCCTSDITLAQFRTLQGKMDSGNPDSSNLEQYLSSTASWRTELYSERGTLMTHAESIQLFAELGVGMAPELKEALVPLPYEGNYTRQMQADQMLQEYRDAGVDAARVWPQSFDEADVSYWLSSAPDFADQVILLDDRYSDAEFDPLIPESWNPDMQTLSDSGLKWLAPPINLLVMLDEQRHIVPSPYASAARAAKLGLITWTLERSGPLNGDDDGGFYYQSIAPVVNGESTALQLLDVLAQDVGVSHVFSDWPATTTYYAHCRL